MRPAFSALAALVVWEAARNRASDRVVVYNGLTLARQSPTTCCRFSADPGTRPFFREAIDAEATSS
jgi:hypothetical protein